MLKNAGTLVLGLEEMVSISNHGTPENRWTPVLRSSEQGGCGMWEEEANLIGLSLEVRYSTRTSIT